MVFAFRDARKVAAQEAAFAVQRPIGRGASIRRRSNRIFAKSFIMGRFR